MKNRMKTRPKILVIEDDPNDEALLMRQLKKADLDEHIQVVRDGRKALNILADADGELSALFLDLNLPGISGLRILEAIRGNEHTQRVPVIIMTSSNSPEQLECCRRLGASSYVQKPLSFSAFAKAFADVFQTGNNASRTCGKE